MKYTGLILKILILLSLILIFGCSKENEDNKVTESDKPIEEEISINTGRSMVYGSLKSPKNLDKCPVVLIIADSGPTDRNGNNTTGLMTNSYKMISDSLAANGIASLRFDKRGVAKSYYSGFNEADLIFDDYIDDVKKWIELLKSDDRFNEIFVLGHSEGALIGSITANRNQISGFISVSGTSQRAGSLLIEQLSDQPDSVINEAKTIISSLNQGIIVKNVSQNLYALFRPSVQPYLISWFKYNPGEEIAKVNVPLIILHGDTDLQISSSAAQELADNNAHSELNIIENMNHVLKNSSNDYTENIATYSNPNLPISDSFCKSVIEFIEKQR